MRHLLWVDCSAAAVAGVLVLSLSGWLSQLEGLPRELLIFTGVVNLLYGCFSFSLAVRRVRPLRLLTLLVVANLAWVPVCVALAVEFRAVATPFGFAHLLGEACFVGVLAVLERVHREQLLTAA